MPVAHAGQGGMTMPKPKSARPPNAVPLSEALLRDLFAAHAMRAIFAGPGARNIADRDGRYDEANWAQVVAMNAYEMADAMLVERDTVRNAPTIRPTLHDIVHGNETCADGKPCYVGRGTRDAHWRCGTV
jgi:hypothetical protein